MNPLAVDNLRLAMLSLDQAFRLLNSVLQMLQAQEKKDAGAKDSGAASQPIDTKTST